MNGIPLQSRVIVVPSPPILHSGILKSSSRPKTSYSFPKFPEDSVTSGTVPPDAFLVKIANTSPDRG